MPNTASTRWPLAQATLRLELLQIALLMLEVSPFRIQVRCRYQAGHGQAGTQFGMGLGNFMHRVQHIHLLEALLCIPISQNIHFDMTLALQRRVTSQAHLTALAL